MTGILAEWPYQTYNRGRWSNDLGTLNFITQESVQRAFASVKTSEVFGIGAQLRGDDLGLDHSEFAHEMVQVGNYSFGPDDEPLQSASDRISVAIHGMTNSHIDALSHVGHRGTSFNDTSFEEIVSMTGARRFTIMDMQPLVTRAWFVDVPRLRGLDFLLPGTPVVPADLEHLAKLVRTGDALVIRTGRYATKVVKPDDPEAQDDHGNWSGLHVDCMELIHEWEISTVATDSSGDNFPSTTPECSVPIHIIAEAYLGLPLIHHLNLEELGSKIAKRTSADFFLCVSPLKIANGTGSPVNPVAII